MNAISNPIISYSICNRKTISKIYTPKIVLQEVSKTLDIFFMKTRATLFLASIFHLFSGGRVYPVES